MNIKKRLIIFNTITIIVPFIIVGVTIFILMFISHNSLNPDKNYDSFKSVATTKSQLVALANNVSKEAPENIEDKAFQKQLYEKLSTINGQFILTKNNNIIFASKDISNIDLEKCLQEMKNSSFKKTIRINNLSYMIEGSSIHFKDNSKGNLILLAPIEESPHNFKKFFLLIIAIFLLSFVAANIFMSYLFSNRILNPITQLKKAATEISNGDLNFEIIESGDEEIRELCADFEKMRVRLKDSIHMKMKLDDNRKMLVSSISHDLKTPITSIKGYVEGILDGVANTPYKKDQYLKTIYSKAEQMDIMIDDLLLYSKLDLNQIPFNFEKTDIIEYFSYCIEESAPLLKKDNIELTMGNNLNKCKYVMIDRERLRRVIVNIIDNSRKYMDKEQGEIIIMLRETNSSIIIEIRDNGSGIDKNDINKIFDRFYRADKARSETKGSGLGLAIGKQIIEGHNGKIWAVSHGNEGTSIIISLAKTA